MNQINVRMMASKYVESDHPTIVIDGIPLDVLLDDLYPDESLLGLVPVNTEWLNMDSEISLVHNRFY
ncbi:hypothetical protein [Paenibacillus sp. MMS18-CY102]|uniref:hypothetical protein n=1 Tax=Paenibacillus sp. MMS18-CY102 TaxID=2682849 RepID=UPI0013657D5D|nr:hypothetical protein [Paenibacillus sp. MMS18-CY102]MWC31167.1 hypothetical protein [Paenibacillus sp. MMS18-CY102]